MILPLEIQDPKTYGGFDISQIKLINNYNAYDLVLIENATELFREVMHDNYGNLEVLLKLVVESVASDCMYLQSETFPYYLSEKTKREYPDWWRNKVSTATKYNSAIATYKRSYLKDAIKRNLCIVGLFAVDLLGSGGHYAAYIWNQRNNKLLIFDSMSTLEGPSGYYPYFQQLGTDLFGTPDELAVPCIKGLLSLQYTGGFSGNVPYYVEEALQKRINSKNANIRRDAKSLLEEISDQSTESQNHFCYMWSIWFIHCLLAGYSLENITATIKNRDIDPLFVIKRYSWNLFKLAGLEKQLVHRDIYNNYFPRVWYNKDGVDSPIFKPYRLDMGLSKNVAECLEISISPVSLKETLLTPVPAKVEKYISDQLDRL